MPKLTQALIRLAAQTTGKIGGKTAAERMTKAERTARAKKAAKASAKVRGAKAKARRKADGKGSKGE